MEIREVGEGCQRVRIGLAEGFATQAPSLFPEFRGPSVIAKIIMIGSEVGEGVQRVRVVLAQGFFLQAPNLFTEFRGSSVIA